MVPHPTEFPEENKRFNSEQQDLIDYFLYSSF